MVILEVAYLDSAGSGKVSRLEGQERRVGSYDPPLLSRRELASWRQPVGTTAGTTAEIVRFTAMMGLTMASIVSLVLLSASAQPPVVILRIAAESGTLQPLVALRGGLGRPTPF